MYVGLIKLIKCIVGCSIIIFLVGCPRSVRKQDFSSEKSISYTELYADSVYLSCPGNMWIPEEQRENWNVYYLAHQRMHRHLKIDSLLHWDFTAEDIKVSCNIYDFVTECWQQENAQLKTGKFKIVRIGEYNYDIQCK